MWRCTVYIRPRTIEDGTLIQNIFPSLRRMPHKTRTQQTSNNKLSEPDLVTLLDQYELYELAPCNRCTPTTRHENKRIINDDDNPYLSVFVEKFLQQTSQAKKTFRAQEVIEPEGRDQSNHVNEILLHTDQNCERRPRTEVTFSQLPHSKPISWRDKEYAEIRPFTTTPIIFVSDMKKQYRMGVYRMSSWRPTLLTLESDKKFAAYLTTHESSRGSHITTIRSPSTQDIRRKYYAKIHVQCSDEKLNTSHKLQIVGTFDTELEILESKNFHIYTIEQQEALQSHQFNFRFILELHETGNEYHH